VQNIRSYSIVIVWLSLIVSQHASAQIMRVQHFKLARNPEEAGFSSKGIQRLDKLITQYVSEGVMPNAVTFIARHGKIVSFKAYGFRDINSNIKLEKDDIFRIASQTKAITSVALMMLYEEGKFMLDDAVSIYVPEFKNPQVLINLDEKTFQYSTRPAKREITIRDLLTHTSGIPYSSPLHQKENIPTVNSLEEETIASVVKRLAKLPLNHDPGEKFTYGLNTDVVGCLIEVLSGKTVDVFFKERIFNPLGMKDTYFYLPETKKNRLVTLYSKDSVKGSLYLAKEINNQTYPIAGAQKYFSGGAGLISTVEDYAKFCQMLLNGGSFNNTRILARKTIDLMTMNQIGDNEVWDSKNKFGLGFEIITAAGTAQVPGSIGSYKWGGMYSTDYTIDPKEDMILLIYTNAYPFANPDINKKFRAMVYMALE
jgi:CubicO group peptidase (beta-lactamase class C family)